MAVLDLLEEKRIAKSKRLSHKSVSRQITWRVFELFRLTQVF